MKNEKLTFSLVHFIGTIILVVFITTQFTSCGGEAPEENEQAKQERMQQRADSLAKVKADSIAAVQKEQERKEKEKKEKEKTVRTGNTEEGYYVVSRGETLASIADNVYGDSSKWYEIFAANETKIDYYNNIYPGMKLKLPETM